MDVVGQFLVDLERAERLPPRALRRRQEDMLASVAAHARSNVAAYRKRLDPVFRADTFLRANWDQVPILTREELREGGQDFFAHNLPSHLKPLKWSATSGTTARPLLYAKTPLASTVSGCINERLMAWHGLAGTQTAAFIYFCKDGEADFPEGKTTTSISPLGSQTTQYWLSNRATITQMIDWLRRKRPAYLTVYPSIAAGIARALGEEGEDMGLRAILTYGEAVSPEDRQVVEGTLAAPVVDAYSANEVGFIALQCPRSETYHIPTDTILVEVVDDSGRPVPDGETGEILVTPFYNTVMPLIRYQIGDLGALATEPCGCGIRLPRLRAIYGRSRQLFTYSDGSRRFANLNIAALQACVPLEQFQLIQHSTTRVELVYVPQTASGPPDMEALQALAHRDLAPDVVIEATVVSNIPRSTAGKLERTISYVAN